MGDLSVVRRPAVRKWLKLYGEIDIGFEAASRLSMPSLLQGEFDEIPIEPRWKDYDDSIPDRPASLPLHWDTSNWVVLLAIENNATVGGAIVARDTPGFNLLLGRSDVALIVDLRVCLEQRGRGVGRKLFEDALRWARSQGCTQLRVETQDTNVAACRFYKAMGCSLESAEENAYHGLDDVKLIWARNSGLPGLTSKPPNT